MVANEYVKPQAVRDAIARAGDMVVWVADNVDGAKLPIGDDAKNNKRVHLGSATLHAALEHANSVAILCEEGCVGSASALLRPLMDAFMRGLWLIRRASDEEVDAAGRDKFPGTGDLLGAIEGLEPYRGNFWSGISERTRKAMHSFTHGGIRQTIARLSSDGVGAIDDTEHALDALRIATTLGYLCAVEFSIIVDNRALFNEAWRRATSTLEQS